MQRNLRRFAHRADEQQDADCIHHIDQPQALSLRSCTSEDATPGAASNTVR